MKNYTMPATTSTKKGASEIPQKAVVDTLALIMSRTAQGPTTMFCRKPALRVYIYRLPGRTMTEDSASAAFDSKAVVARKHAVRWPENCSN